MEQPASLKLYNNQVPTHIEQAIHTALAKDRNHRHADVRVFLTALQAPQKWLKEGYALRGLKRYEEALAVFEQALRLDPNFAFASNNKGIVLRDLKRYEEALAAYEQALRLDPKYANAYHGKGITLDKLGRNGEAQQAYNTAKQLRGET